MYSPTNPPINPKAIDSTPNLLRIIETFIPFPPGSIESE
jgi:hypothetical protein